MSGMFDETVTQERVTYKVREVSFPLTLPCGYVDREGTLHREVELARMQGAEEDLLTDQTKLRDGLNIRQIIANCLTRIGSYSAPKEGRNKQQRDQFSSIVENLTIADKTFLLIMLRRISLKDGDIYRFKTGCTNPQCKHEFINRLDLGELDIVPMPRPGERIGQLKLPSSGDVVRFRPLYVYDEPKLAELAQRYKDKFMSAILWSQIIDINGQKVVSHVDLQKYDMMDREELRSALQENEGGIDIDITMDCPKCGNEMQGKMEIEPSFFIPSALGSKWRA